MGKKDYDSPDSPSSVGWTEAKVERLATADEPFELVSGGAIGPVDVEYETYGEINSARDNVIVISHALSGDAHVAGWDKNAEETGRAWRTKKPGWWDTIVGPDKTLDTNKYFIICANVLGSCYGTTGPAAINPETEKPYATDFPGVTIHDWVSLQAKLLDHLGIDKIFAVIGGSLGGQQALEWALAYPDRVERVVILAASARLSTQGLAFNAVGRHCIISDGEFNNGNYYDGQGPKAGLAAARMLAHITYLSDESMHEKFGRKLQKKDKTDFDFGVEFQVESYLNYQGWSFVERFDANSYLYITRAMDYYDPAEFWGEGSLAKACSRIKSKIMTVSFSSDWLYTPTECREFIAAMGENNKPVTYIEVPSQYGHDAFLIQTEEVGALLSNFLNAGGA